MQVVMTHYAVDILTAHYRVYGEIRTRGDPTLFFNDQSVSTLTVYDATFIPLRQGMRLGALTTEELHIPRVEPQIITLGNYVPQIRPLPKAEQLVCFTDTYLLRGTFHMSPDTRIQDVFYMQSGPFFYVSQADIYGLYNLAVDVKARAELAYIRGQAVRAFFKAPAPGSTDQLMPKQ